MSERRTRSPGGRGRVGEWPQEERCDGGCAFPKDCWVRGFGLVQGRSIVSRRHRPLCKADLGTSWGWRRLAGCGCAYIRRYRELATGNRACVKRIHHSWADRAQNPLLGFQPVAHVPSNSSVHRQASHFTAKMRKPAIGERRTDGERQAGDRFLGNKGFQRPRGRGCSWSGKFWIRNKGWW